MIGKKNIESDLPAPDANARLTVSAEDKTKAGKWFDRARELGDKRQFDYAIEYYVNGLEFWPDAVDEACKALHGCAVARKQLGGKKPGLKDSMTRSTSDKDAKKAYVNALWLFGHEPDNLSYMEAVVRNAGRLRAENAAKWATGVYTKALEANAKAGTKQFQSLCQLTEELGDRAGARGEVAFGVEVYQMGVEVVQLWRRRTAKDPAADNSLKQISTKLTILKGKYDKGEGYRGSIVDSEEQEALHDKHRTVQGDDRVDQLIARAAAAFQANPDKAGVLREYTDLLCRREREEEETTAIGLLVGEFKRTNDYRWKQLADDVRIKQLGRAAREAAKGGQEEQAKQARIDQLRFELKVFKDRSERYPSDLRLKFELAIRRFNAGQFDDAIPLFQQARSDLKNRASCGVYLGRCFHRKEYYDQAIAALEDTLLDFDGADEDMGKSLHYWLARAQEARGDVEAARKTYGTVLQMDYTYRDVRARLDALQKR